MLWRAALRYTLIFSFVLNLMAVQVSAAQLAGPSQTAKVRPADTSICNFDPTMGTSQSGIFGDIQEIDVQGSNVSTNPLTGAAGGVITVTKVVNNALTNTSFSSPTTAFPPFTAGGGFYFSAAHVSGFNLGPGDDFIIQFHDNSGIRPDLFYPNRLSNTSAMRLHLSRGITNAVTTNDIGNPCDMIDSYATNNGDDLNNYGGLQPAMYTGPLMGGRVVERAAFDPNANINNLKDSDIFNPAVTTVSGGQYTVSICPWNYNYANVGGEPALPNPSSSSCVQPYQNSSTFGQDNQGYYLVGNGQLPANKYIAIYQATNFRTQAYYYKDLSVPPTATEKDGLGFQITNATQSLVVPPPSGAPTGQTQFNAVLNGASSLIGTVKDGRNNCTNGSSPFFNQPVSGSTVLAYDTLSPNAIVSQGLTDSNGNYSLPGLSPDRNYQIRYIPPYYNGVVCDHNNSNFSSEFATGIFTTSSSIGISTTQNFQLQLGAGLSGTVSTSGGSTFSSNTNVQVLIYDNNTNSSNAIFSQLLQPTSGSTSVSYTFPRLLQTSGQYNVQFTPVGSGNPSFASAWYSSSAATGSLTRANATTITGGGTNINLTLVTGYPLVGTVSLPNSLRFDTSPYNTVSVQVNILEADNQQLVTSFFIGNGFGATLTSNGSLSWTGPAVLTTTTYLVQYVPSPGNTTGFSSAYYKAGSTAGTPAVGSATAIAFVNNVANQSADVTLKLGGEIFVTTLNGNNLPFSGVSTTILGTKADGSCDTTNIVATNSTSSYDGTADFKNLPASPTGPISYCINFVPAGNIASLLYGAAGSGYAPVQVTAGNKQQISVVLSAPGVSLSGHLYAVDNSYKAGVDFSGWTVDVVKASDGTTVFASFSGLTRDVSYDNNSRSNSYFYNFNIPYANNQAFYIRFTSPASGTNYSTEYASDTLVNGHSPFDTSTAKLFQNSGTTPIVQDGVFLAGGFVTFQVTDNNNAPLASAPVQLYQGSTSGSPVFNSSSSPTGTVTAFVVIGTYYAYVGSPSGSTAYTPLWYNQSPTAVGATAFVVNAGSSQTLNFKLSPIQPATPTAPPPTATNTPVPPTATPTTSPPVGTPTPLPPTATSTPAPAGYGQVQGTVSYSSNGVAVGLVQTSVQAYDLSDNAVSGGSAMTDQNGNYTLSVPAGSYKIYFSNSSLNSTAWYSAASVNGASDFSSASPVGVAGNGSLTNNVNLTFGGTGPSPTPSGPPPYIYYLPFLANSSGGFTTYLAFQNVGTGAASLSLAFYNPDGSYLSLDSTCPTLAAQAECVPPNPLQGGKQGVGRIISSQPLNVIIAEATPYGGSAYAVSQGASSSLIAPLAINKAYGNFVTRITIFNGGNTNATGTLNFFRDTGEAMTGATKSFSIAPQTSASFDQTDGSLPAGFNGWAQITGNAGSQLVAQVLEQNPDNRFVAIANAQAAPFNTVFAPAIFHNYYGGFSTGSNIVNPNSTAVNVNITYYDLSGHSTTIPQFSLPAHAISAIYQGNTQASGLPDPYGGAAVVKADGGGVVMVVNEQGGRTTSGSSKSGVYSGAGTGGSSVGLPAIAHNGYGVYNTGATIFNTTNQTVTGSLQYYDLTGNKVGTGVPFSIQPFASQPFYQGTGGQSPPPDQFYGSAIVTQNSGPANAMIVTTNAVSDSIFYSYTEPN